MANMPHRFKHRDVQRVIKAARSAGLDPASVEVDPHSGRIRVHSRGVAEVVNGANPWDQAIADAAKPPEAHARRKTPRS
jgi:hypothetical protein